ncbi:hybrid sensor histidine kinase/response regulator [Psychroserpens sp. Hel_I_66]|uniref:hybrid sensor histidine kinase/response regulator n=1 Tax=Psychroserpens sp. Hel_I_66 TaxID=1250004 RepID=UPI00068EA51C|nr:hybrid sensor histidine kinase/response regulator [Psychroserpens sp. Hel_I_66]
MKLTLLFTLFLGLSLYAQDVTYNPETSKGKLFEYAEFANVGKETFGLESILTNPDIEYENLESENHSVGFTTDNFWVRFKLENSDDIQKTYYLETARPITDIALMYQISEEGITTAKSGDQIPFKERQLNHRATIFKLELPANSTHQIYLHLNSDGETINMPLNLYSETSFWEMNYRQQLFLGLFYGLLSLAAIIYLFFYTSLKEKTFLYYGIYVFSIGLMQAALDGFIHQYILPDGGYLNGRTVLIAALFSNFFLLKYCEYFLKVNERLASFKKFYNAIYLVIGVLFVMIFISPKTLELVYPISNLNGLLSLILILSTVFTLRFKRMSIDPYFSFGIFFLVVGLCGFVMNNLSLLPNNFYTLNSAKFGSGFEVIFLSLSMTNLIRNLRLEKEKSQNEALYKSEEISELKTYFMSNISHELRTPINAIMGIAELEIKDQNNTVESRKQYEIIKNASLSLLSNVNDILDFENIQKNELELKHEEFNPSIAIRQISNNWKVEAENKGLAYSFEMDHEIPTKVIGDAERFMQIINNVLGNAVKFTEEGYVKFKLKCFTQPNNISRFSLQISDSGVGIDTERRRSMFDSFNQMKLNHKRKFGGIGLGLTIVNHLVGLFGGTINLESQEEKGTDVFIELPLEYIPKADAPTNDDIQTQSNPQHVLVVEDNKLNQMVMRKLLSSSSHISFAIVDNGQEALDALKNDVYDIILMDLQMPIMDGYEATKIIRSGQLGLEIGGIPIIAVTADAMQETRQRVLGLGMNDYMTKPVNKELLFKKIDECQSKQHLKIA